MGAILMQGGKTIFFHSKTFTTVVSNYPTYDIELYALVQMGKETIIHIDHLLQYLHSQSKLQQSRHFRLMGFPK